ncbi:hypothetical protein ACSS6W_001628 [Trichoderma asperelloides]
MESVSYACVGESLREDNGGGESIRRMEGSILEGGEEGRKGTRVRRAAETREIGPGQDRVCG